MDYGLLTDNALLTLLKSNSDGAFKEIYGRYRNFVFLTILKKGYGKELAEEFTQQIFMHIWEKRQTIQIRVLSHYLSVAVKNRILNYIKSCTVRQQHRMNAGYCMIKTTDTASVLLMHELSAAIAGAIHKLPEKSRHIFQLSRFGECSIREIAQKMNISEKGVEYHITQSLKTLRLQLREYFN